MCESKVLSLRQLGDEIDDGLTVGSGQLCASGFGGAGHRYSTRKADRS